MIYINILLINIVKLLLLYYFITPPKKILIYNKKMHIIFITPQKINTFAQKK